MVTGSAVEVRSGCAEVVLTDIEAALADIEAALANVTAALVAIEMHALACSAAISVSSVG